MTQCSFGIIVFNSDGCVCGHNHVILYQKPKIKPNKLQNNSSASQNHFKIIPMTEN